MMVGFITKVLMKAVNICLPEAWFFTVTEAPQYIRMRYRQLLAGYALTLRAFMDEVGRCNDSAVVERFFGSLKHNWIFKVYQPTRDLNETRCSKLH